MDSLIGQRAHDIVDALADDRINTAFFSRSYRLFLVVMNEKNADEIRYRRLAFKLFDKGISPTAILKRIPRSRAWLFKWRQRFAQQRWRALDSFAKAPKHQPQQYDAATVKLVLRLRKQLQRSQVGLVGARAIQREIKRHRLLSHLPSLASIKRWLKAAGLTQSDPVTATSPFYPTPRLPPLWAFYSCDWVARYLEGGAKVFVFHTIDLHTQALCQTSGTDKSTASLCAHLLAASRELGLPDFLQLDNDAAFTGLGKRPRVFGHFVRLALYLGIELLFIPPGEPKRNHVVEGINHLWAQSFWDRNHFTSVNAFQRKRAQFLTWYEDYEPPLLAGLSVKQARRGGKARKLTKREIQALPGELPLTEGRLHYIRRVNERGDINLLKEDWKVSKRLRGEYVWATIEFRAQRLKIYYRSSERGQAKLVKEHAYHLGERVESLQAAYRRDHRRVPVSKII